MALSYEETILVGGNLQGVSNKLLEALKDVGFNVKQSDVPGGYIKASLSMNLYSWGEAIDITFKQSGDKVSVHIKSRSVVPTLSDWGRNKKNVKKLREALEKRME